MGHRDVCQCIMGWDVPIFGMHSSFRLNDHTSTISSTDSRLEPPCKKGIESTGKYCW